MNCNYILIDGNSCFYYFNITNDAAINILMPCHSAYSSVSGG
jgi:hypothetical protein